MIHAPLRSPLVRVARALRRSWAISLVLAACGCQSYPAPELDVPDGWIPTELSTYTVPGDPIAAWRGPEDASLVVYATMPAPGATPEVLSTIETNRFRAYPGATDIQGSVVRLTSGVEAARFEVVAAGRAGLLAPPVTGIARTVGSTDEPDPETGNAGGESASTQGVGDGSLIRLRRVSLAIPEAGRVLWVAWHFPDASRDEFLPQIERMIESLRLSGDAEYGS